MRKNLFYIFFSQLLPAFLLSVSITFAGSPTIQLKEPGVIHVTSYSKFEPISYGNGQGYEADLLKAIAKFWHVKIKFHTVNTYKNLWLIPSIPGSKSDIAIGGLTPLNYRIKEGARFTNITIPFAQSLLIRKKDYHSGRIVSYASFKNTKMRIGVVPETTGEKFAYILAKENGLPRSVIVQYASESALLPALINGKIDAIARGEIGNEYQTSKNKNFVTIAKRDFNEGFSFAVDASNQLLVEQLNQAIQIVTHNGHITYEKWLKNHNVFLDNLLS